MRPGSGEDLAMHDAGDPAAPAGTGAEKLHPPPAFASLQTMRWLQDFQDRHGRPLRVLHIGNIANNAFRNASIQRRIGIEADVVCYDYYHIMGCPEWEEADLGGGYDAFWPDWWKIDAGGWRRPEWFIQGPLTECLAVLAARRSGAPATERKARLAMVQAYATLLDVREKSKVRDVLAADLRATTERLAPELKGYRLAGSEGRIDRLRETFEDAVSRYSSLKWRQALAEQTLVGLLDPALRRTSRGALPSACDRLSLAIYRSLRTLKGTTHQPLRKPAEIGYWSPDPSEMGAVKLTVRYLAGTLGSTALRPIAAGVDWMRARGALPGQSPVVSLAGPEFAERLAVRYRAANRNFSASEIDSDIRAAMSAAERWRYALAHYDIIQGYSTDASIPFFAGHPQFTAYEHGTIRDIPFEPSYRGRICRFTYANVQRAMITNTDVLPSAEDKTRLAALLT